MASLYLVKKPQVSGQIARWCLLFLEHDFLVVYKPEKSHSIANASSCLHTSDEPNGVPDQVIDAPFFLLQLAWL